MIKNAGIEEKDIEAIVTAKGHYKADQHLSDYCEDFLARWVVPNFKKIVDAVNKSKTTGGND